MSVLYTFLSGKKNLIKKIQKDNKTYKKYALITQPAVLALLCILMLDSGFDKYDLSMLFSCRILFNPNTWVLYAQVLLEYVCCWIY